MQKTLKPSKKMFQLPRWMRRNFRGISAEGKVIDGKMRCKLLQKRSTGKTTRVFKNLWHIATEKDIFSELNRCIFPISLKYIKVSYSKNTLHAGIMQF